MNGDIGNSNKKKSSHVPVSKNNKLTDLRSIRFFNLYNQQANEITSSSPHKRLGRRRSTLLSIPTISDALESEYDDTRKLIEFAEERIMDTLITIHMTKSDIPLYVSDISHGDADPQFLTNLGNIPSNTHKCIIKLWIRRGKQWSLLCFYKIDVNKLGREKIAVEDDSFDMFKENSLCLKLRDSWYTFPDMLVSTRSVLDSKTYQETPLRPINSYNFDQLRSINNIYKSIKELDVSKTRLKQQIHKYVGEIDFDNVNNLPILLDQLRYNCRTLESDINKITSSNEIIRSQNYNAKQKVSDGIELLSHFENLQELIKDKFEIYDHEISSVKKNRDEVKSAIKQRLKEDVLVINELFSIRDISTTCFSILGFEFPPSIKTLKDVCYYNETSLKNYYYEPSFDSESQWHEFTISQVNASISFIVQLVTTLSKITETPLLYKMVLFGSQSFIMDDSKVYPIAGKNPVNTAPPFKFPLYFDSKDVNNEKVLTSQGSIIMNQEFEFGLKLLGRNISRLVNYVKENICDESGSGSIPSDCQDNFLWNLKYLELLMTA
ncbi:hypothetical protein KGF57_002368 [Candida theae]|uniref:Uncharacterized protein n=1 Tax=Candida theae TaxID=1198502 RepID=A0AAD5BFG4_9ASCO|nr:uncharacterized protein KGF57_002368 [Candida theae]KAI5958934.1 hypothetical protein KGF57_002368 [Candida theae]